MSKKITNSKNASQNAQKNAPQNVLMKNLKMIGVVAAVAVVGIIVLVYSSLGKSSQTATGDTGGTNASQSSDGVIMAKSEINENAKFYPYEVDGTKMELLAFKASDGTIRTSFNTCEVCQNSGRGYYVQDGDVLVCQNCGNRFPAERVGIEVGGCNPVPILETDRTEDDETITVSADFIKQYKDYFRNWKNA